MEKKLTDEQDNLLIEFDGYGFVPTITMPNSEEYAIEWKKRLIRVFDRQNAEIERLTEIRNSFRQEVITLNNEKLELQKQVDELKGYAEDIYKNAIDREEDAYSLGFDKGKEQAVKDTAKEIFEWLEKHCFSDGFEIVETYFKERYGVEVE